MAMWFIGSFFYDELWNYEPCLPLVREHAAADELWSSD